MGFSPTNSGGSGGWWDPTNPLKSIFSMAHIEIVDLPSWKMVDFSIVFLKVYQAGYPGFAKQEPSKNKK
jgi:hypothetical protein